MKKRMLVILIVMGLAVGTASAQFGGVVYDPTNYANALKRYFQLQQQLVSCPGDFVSTNTSSWVGIGPAKWFCRFGIGANVFPQFAG